mgnify:FL=1
MRCSAAGFDPDAPADPPRVFLSQSPILNSYLLIPGITRRSLGILARKGGDVVNVHVNENCIGCGLCVNMCGSAFLMTEEGVAAARDEIFPEQEGQVQEAAESCPVNAIEVHH